MTNFWDLPKTIRQKIYRLSLVRDEPVTLADLRASSAKKFLEDEKNTKHTPCLLVVDTKIEREAVDIFFGENTFELHAPQDIHHLLGNIWRRHWKHIRKVTVASWPPSLRKSGKWIEDDFGKFRSLRQLEELTVVIDERETIHKLLKTNTPPGKWYSSPIKWHSSLGYGQQIQLQMLRLDGIRSLRKLRDLKAVNFASPSDVQRTGAIPGGLLEVIKREMMQSSKHTEYVREGHFRFLELPPELRNIIYGMLLVNSGVTYPDDRHPTSARANLGYKRDWRGDYDPAPDSALEILRVNRQIRGEAHKLFYHDNELAFSHPGRLQNFLGSIGSDRLDCIRSVTLFCPSRRREEGFDNIDAAILSLRLLRGLQKLQVLDSSYFWGPEAGYLKGVAALFFLRNLKDIKYIYPAAEALVESGDQNQIVEAKRAVAGFQHLSYALQLAQKGMAVGKPFIERGRFLDETWPALEGSDCGRTKGCSCGQIDTAEEVVEET